MDRKIDDLGAEGRIQSEDDARSYVQALSDRLGLEKKGLQQLSDFKLRLAHAEYVSLTNPSKRVPEPLVADAFNKLMDEWRMPTWTRVNSVLEIHAFRVVMSVIVNPKSASRLPDQNIATTCRPVEAVYLIWLLDSQIRIPPALREKLRIPGWLEGVPRNLEIKSPPLLRASAGNLSEDGKRRLAYLGRRSKYFSQHSSEEATKRISQILTVVDVE